jgi:hypothetical protein
MKPIPRLTILTNHDGSKYALGGWEELNHWGRNNDVTWREMTMALGNLGYSEVDKLKFLCAALLMQLHRQLPPIPQEPMALSMCPTTGRFSLYVDVHSKAAAKLTTAIDLFGQTFPDDYIETYYDVVTCNQIVTCESLRFAWWWAFFGGREGSRFFDGEGRVLQ